MIKLSINVTRIPKSRIFEGKKGKYLDLVLFEKPDDYGNAGFVKIDVSKAARDSGDNGEIIGNWKIVGEGRKNPPPPNRPPSGTRITGGADDAEDDIPF